MVLDLTFMENFGDGNAGNVLQKESSRRRKKVREEAWHSCGT
jgi:hypothetical protein